MTDRCCCNDRFDIRMAQDTTCVVNYLSGSEWHPRFREVGNLTYTVDPVFSEYITIEGGSGGVNYYRLSHSDWESSGASTGLVIDTALDGGIPASGILRCFLHDWVVEIDWSDQYLRAYSCDSEGNPSGSAWYEQDLSDYFSSDTWQSGAVDDDPNCNIVIGVHPVSAGVWDRYVLFNLIPVVLQKDVSWPAAFWYGINAEHGGDDFSFYPKPALNQFGFVCNSFGYPPSSVDNTYPYAALYELVTIDGGWQFDFSPGYSGTSDTDVFWGSSVILGQFPITGHSPGLYGFQKYDATYHGAFDALTGTVVASLVDYSGGGFLMTEESTAYSANRLSHVYATPSRSGSGGADDNLSYAVSLYKDGTFDMKGPEPLILTPHGLDTPPSPPS